MTNAELDHGYNQLNLHALASLDRESDTSSGGQSEFDTYSGCGAVQDESGTEYVYELTRRLTLASPATTV